MVESVSKYTSPPNSTRRRTRPPEDIQPKQKRSFALVEVEAISAFGHLFDPAAALLLELLRVSGLRSTKRRDGWILLDQERLAALRLDDKGVRHRAMQRLRARGVIEVRSRYGRKLEYRLDPNWVKPKAAVVDLESVRKARNR